MWAVARYDLGLSLEEFGSMTPGMFENLMKRRTARHRYNCLYAGMIASAIANYSGKVLNDGVTVSPFDFVPMPPDPKDDMRKNLRTLISLIQWASPNADMGVIRSRAMTGLIKEGYEPEEVEELLTGMFPKWQEDGELRNGYGRKTDDRPGSWDLPVHVCLG